MSQCLIPRNRSASLLGALLLLLSLLPVGVMAPAALAEADTPLVDAAADASDVTFDGLISNADIMRVVNAWTDARESGNRCGDFPADLDVNGDGCLDIADIQTVSARLGATTQASAENQSMAQGQEFAASAAGGTFTVNSTGDGDDAAPGDGACAAADGTCTLRAAIAEANRTPGPNTIAFNLPGGGIQTIFVPTELPEIHDETGGTTIDGYTQPGASPNSDPRVSNAQIRVQIVGPRTAGNYVSINAFVITSSNNVVRGLSFSRFKRNIWISGAGANGNVVTGNFIGLPADGQPWYDQIARTDNIGGDNGAYGIWLAYGASNNRIGGTAPADRNVISGNANDGVGGRNDGTSNNVVIGNLVGLGPSGTTRVRNWGDGFDFNYGASHNRFGGESAAERNVVSGNAGDGFEISHDPSTSYNQVIGNYIGTSVDGKAGGTVYQNTGFAVTLEDGVSNNQIGPNNVMANNIKGGVQMYGNGNEGNHVYQNRIGVNIDGAALANSGPGVYIRYHAMRSTIGPDNIIANNAGPGVLLRDSDNDFVTITRNSIYDNGGLGIDIDPDGINLNDQYSHSGPNERLNFPVITSVTTGTVSGTACAGCTVEVFVAAPAAGGYGEGKTIVGSGTATAAGAFEIVVSGVNPGDMITSTATDTSGNTSEFSKNVVVDGSTPPPPTTKRISLPGQFQAEDYNAGGEGVGYHDTDIGDNGRKGRADNVDVGSCSDGAGCLNVGWIDTGEWLAYDVNVTTAGTYTFSARVASTSTGRKLSLEVDGQNVTGNVVLPKTGGWDVWQTVTSNPFTLSAGDHTLKVVFGNCCYNVNWFSVDALTGDVTAPAPPSGFGATVTSGNVVLKWNANSEPDLKGYNLSRSASPTGPFTPLSGSLLTATTYTDSTVAAGSTVYYRVTAVDQTGNMSGPSQTSATIPSSSTGLPVPGLIQAEDFDNGVEGTAYHDTTLGNNGGVYRSSDVDIQRCTDTSTTPGTDCYNIGWTDPGEWLAYTLAVTEGGIYQASIRVATSGSNRSFHLELDGVNISGPVIVPNSGGWQTWTTITLNGLQIPAKTHRLRIVLDTGLFNLNWIELKAQ
jgi:CSLREA domain-containing protein